MQVMAQVAVLAALTLGGATVAMGGDSAATRPAVARRDLLAAQLAGGKVIAKVDIKEVTMGPGAKAPLHLHPCAVVGVVLEGSIAYQIEGQAVVHLKAGDAFYEPAEVRIARFDNEGTGPAKFAAFYLLEREDQPLIRMLEK